MIKNILIILGLCYIIGTFIELLELRKQVQLLENNFAECQYHYEKAVEKLERITK